MDVNLNFLCPVCQRNFDGAGANEVNFNRHLEACKKKGNQEAEKKRKKGPMWQYLSTKKKCEKVE